MEDHPNAFKLKIGSVPAPGDRGGNRVEEKELDLGIFGENWEFLEENVQSANMMIDKQADLYSRRALRSLCSEQLKLIYPTA